MTQINKRSEDYPPLSEQSLQTSDVTVKKAFSFLSIRLLLISKAFCVLLCLLASTITFAQGIFIKAPSTTTITSSVKPSIAGQPVLLIATITSPSQFTPTGIVHFYDYATNTDLTPGGIALSNGIATFTTAALSTNTSFKATYNGDDNILSSTSIAYEQTVYIPVIIITPKSFLTTTNVVSNSNPSVAGSAVTFTATVGSTGAANLTGLVEFWDNTNNKNLTPGGVAVSNGVATFTTSSLPFGDLNITAIYREDANGNQQSISNIIIQHVMLNFSGIGFTLTSSSSSNTSNWGRPVTFTANFSTGVGAPSGKIIFTDNGYLLGTALMNGSGTASLTKYLFSAGSHNITASYLSLTSNVLIQIVNPRFPPEQLFAEVGIGFARDAIACDRSLSFGSYETHYNEPVTFAATVQNGIGIAPPTGTFTFYDGGTELGVVGLDPTGSGVFTTSILSLGDHVISVSYSGDDAYRDQQSINDGYGIESPSLTIKVLPSSTTTSISSNLNPAVAGQQITFTSTVLPPSTEGNALPPGGNVTFIIDGVNQAPAPLTGNNYKAFFDISTLSVGNHTIKVSYPGNANYGGSNSGSITQVVEPVGSAVFNFLGNTQTTKVNTVFTNPVSFDILNINPRLVGGASVTFTAPASGASGTFSNGTNSITVKTTQSLSIGIADSGPFTANGIGGTYDIIATIQGMGTNIFTMTNTAPLVQITVGTSVPGLSFTADGLSYSANTTFDWEQGSNHTITTSSPQSLGVGTQYSFSDWSDGKTTLSNSLTVPSIATSYIAQFQCTQKWVLDKDLDTYYTGDPIITCQSPGAGYLPIGDLKPGDCDDNNADINPKTLWSLDADGDGYASNLYIPSPGGSCPPPQDGRHYIYNSKGSDCDDSDPVNNPGSVWVFDNDGDGYYTGDPITGCQFITIEGLVKKISQQPGDCNDNNTAVHPGASEIADNLDNNCDGSIDEGICLPTVQTKNITVQLTPGGNIIIAAEDINNGSFDGCGALTLRLDKTTFYCNNIGQNIVTLTAISANGAIASATAVVTVEDHALPTVITKNITAQIDAGGVAIIADRDVDDGSYDACGLVLYKLDKTRFDCSNVGANTVTLTVTDANGNKASGTAIVTVKDHTLPIVITKNITVQLDAAGSVTVNDRDVDNGSYDPCGLVLYKLDKTNFTCFNVGQNAVTLTVKDINGNIASGTAIITVQGNAAVTWYLDADYDGYAASSIVSCTNPGNGYTASAIPLGDCDDSKADINPATRWYIDVDNDGYPGTTTATQCIRPVFNVGPFIFSNGKLASELINLAPDCDDLNANSKPVTWYKDADNDGYSDGTTKLQCSQPAGYKLPAALSATSGDCNDANTGINPNSIWYKDADNDGYSSGATTRQCLQPAGYKLASQLTALNGDCNDNDRNITTLKVYYQDADSDGFGNPAKITSVCSLTPPAGYVANKADCNDANVSISPLAMEVCGNGIDDNCNGLVDEVPCYPCRNAASFTTTSITSTSAQLNWTATANPVQWQIQYKSTRPGTKWIDFLLTGNLRTYKLGGLSAGINYQWQIRAKCGNTWTSYSSSVSFKTPASGTTIKRIEESVSIAAAETSTFIRLHPNPTYGVFNLEVQQPDVSATTAVVNIRDIAGRLVKSEKTGLVKGLLKTSMRLPASVTPGMYLVEVRINKEVYFAKLIYTK